TRPDVLELNPRGGWIARRSRFSMAARAANRPESSGDRVSGQTNSFWRSLTGIRTDAIKSAGWCSENSRTGKREEIWIKKPTHAILFLQPSDSLCLRAREGLQRFSC